MTAPRLILHVGAPKCGSSALQTALSRQPTCTTPEGMTLRYTAQIKVWGTSRPVSGAQLKRGARYSPYGYLSWSNFAPGAMPATTVSAVNAMLRWSERRPVVPVLSNEGWVRHHAEFGALLDAAGHPPVDVVAFLRAPVDWLNSAYWQWGAWSTHSMDTWLERSGTPYDFVDRLEAWARIPNVRLRVFPARPDVTRHFASAYGIELSGDTVRNVSSPPSLIGFLLRNRQFRPTGHDARSEFIYQRWCPPTGERSLWVVEPRHVWQVRPRMVRLRERLRALVSPEVWAGFMEDPRWSSERPYHPQILAGRTSVSRQEDLPGLFASLSAGVETAAQAAGRRRAAPPLPASSAPILDWDAALATLFQELLDHDTAWRRRASFALFQDRARPVTG